MSDDIYDRPKGMFSKIQAVLVGVLVGMLVLAFAVWGIEDVFSPNSSNAIIKVGDSEVGREEFLDRFNDQMRQFAQENGEGLTPQQAFDRGIPQQLIAEFSQRLAISEDATDLGIGVNNRNILEFAKEIDAFQNSITQEFDRQQLQRILAANRMTEADFEQDVRNALTERQTLPAIMGGIEAPSEYAQRYNQFINETRGAKLIQYGVAALDELPQPTDEDLQNYITDNQGRFTAPEYRRFLMLRIEPFDFRQDIEITEEQLEERFETLLGAGEIGSVETRNVTVLAVDTQEIADSVAARLSAGEDAGAVAEELGLPSPDLFNNVEENALINPESSRVAFEAELGTAQVAPTGFGTFEVVYIRDINPADVPVMEEMREELTEQVLQGEALRRINDYERVIDDRLLEGGTIEEIAEALELPLSSYPYIDRTGRTQDGMVLDGFDAIPGIASDDQLLQAVFTGDIGFESDIIPSSNGGLAIFRVTDTIPSAPEAFEDVRDEAAAMWTSEQIAVELNNKGVEIERRLREGETLEAIAAELGTGVAQISIQRAAPTQDVAPAVLIRLLDGDVGTVARGAGRVPGTYEVAELTTISSESERISGQFLNIVRNQVSEQIALDISRAYQQAILTDKDQLVFDNQLRAALNLEPEG
ncbi:MAG: SurA N-terminal domain-containing protein [Pseudomonadota bacterium]